MSGRQHLTTKQPNNKICLEDSTTIIYRLIVRRIGWITKSAHSPLAHSPRSKSITDNPDATDLFFTDFCFYVDWYAPLRRFDFYGFPLLYGLSADYLLLGYIQRRTGARKNPEKKQDQVYLRIRKSVKKIKSVASVLSVSHFERMCTEPQGEGAM